MRRSGCERNPGRLVRGALLAVIGLLVACAAPAEPRVNWTARTAEAELARALDAEARGDRQQALELGRRAAQHAREAAALGTVGQALLLVGRVDSDLAPCLEALEIFEYDGNLPGRVEAHGACAQLLLALGRPDDALAQAERGNALLDEAGLDRAEWARLSAPIQHAASASLRALGRHPEAQARERQAQIALSLLDDRQLPALRVAVQLGLGADERVRGWPTRSVEHYGQALDLAQRLGDRGSELEALTGLVMALTDLRRFADAVSYCERALELARETGDADSVQDLGRRGLQLLLELGGETRPAQRRSFEEALLARR